MRLSIIICSVIMLVSILSINDAADPPSSSVGSISAGNARNDTQGTSGDSKGHHGKGRGKGRNKGSEHSNGNEDKESSKESKAVGDHKNKSDKDDKKKKDKNSFAKSRFALGSSPFSVSTWRAAATSGQIFGGQEYLHFHSTTTQSLPTICTNKNVPGRNGIIYVICPQTSMPSNYTYCCGHENEETCCDKTDAKLDYQNEYVKPTKKSHEHKKTRNSTDVDDDKDYKHKKGKHQGDSGNITSSFGWVGFICLFGLTNVLMTFN